MRKRNITAPQLVIGTRPQTNKTLTTAVPQTQPHPHQPRTVVRVTYSVAE
ncbi:MAG: hypothetical protein GY796_34085 [Chloroflexi bacterium]|nr:hypothetical protein [Chloroflexota bacterium]